MGSLRRRLTAAAVLGLALVAAVGPGAAEAHPLGNYTINHAATLVVGRAMVELEIVIDMAEIPAFAEIRRFDADTDGGLDADEIDAARTAACAALTDRLDLRLDGAPLALAARAAGLTLPPGAGGLATLRLVCRYDALPVAPIGDGDIITFADGSYAERLGWREIVALGDGTTLVGTDGVEPRAVSPSDRLRRYPSDRLRAPLDDRMVELVVGPGARSASLPPADDVEALTLAAAGGPLDLEAAIGAVFRAPDPGPSIVLGSLLLAALLGAGHALTPGHGKTLMAAALVGSRGTLRQAVGLGLSVTVSHTLGILVLAILVTGATAALPPDAVVRTLPLVAAVGFVAIGAWMLGAELRSRLAGRRADRAHAIAHDQGRPHGHDQGRPHAHDHGHAHDHPHRHGPDASPRPLGWRGLFAIGLTGGLIPSTNALLILLGALAAGRAAFGIVLVVAFGLGMAVVLGGVGAGLVLARDRVARLPGRPAIGRALAVAPLVASVGVLAIGLVLTGAAVSELGGA